MSNQELVNAYTDGRISRRTLVRGLVAAGVSTGAAVSYAHLLAPEASGAGRRYADEYPGNCADEYPSIDMLVLDRKVADVRRAKKLRVKARFSRADFGGSADNLKRARIKLTVSARKNGTQKTLGSKTVELTDGRASEIKIPLDGDLSPLRGADRVTVFVTAKRVDSDVFCKPSSPRNLIRIRGKLN